MFLGCLWMWEHAWGTRVWGFESPGEFLQLWTPFSPTADRLRLQLLPINEQKKQCWRGWWERLLTAVAYLTTSLQLCYVDYNYAHQFSTNSLCLLHWQFTSNSKSHIMPLFLAVSGGMLCLSQLEMLQLECFKKLIRLM